MAFMFFFVLISLFMYKFEERQNVFTKYICLLLCNIFLIDTSAFWPLPCQKTEISEIST